MAEKQGNEGRKNCCSKLAGIADEFSERWLGKLGTFVGANPGYFLIVPPLCCIIFLTSFQTMKAPGNELQAFLPTGRRSETDRVKLFTNFPAATTLPYDDDRVPMSSYRGEVIFRARGGGSVLTARAWREILALDSAVRAIRVEDPARPGVFVGLDTHCARFGGRCVRDDFLSLPAEVVADVEQAAAGNGTPVAVTLPAFSHPRLGGRTLDFTAEFGGPIAERGALRVVTTVLAIRAKYILLYNPPVSEEKGYFAWEVKFGEVVRNFSSQHVEALWYTATEDAKEGDETTAATLPLIGVSAAVVLAYCLLATVSTDWVRSKPYVAFFGVLSTCMGTGTAFGICLYAGVGFSNINYAVPFLMLGIGMDDTFVMLSAWRRTSLSDPVPLRMHQTYTEAAVSLLISTLTDVISYWIGSITPFPAVGTFCRYAGTSVMILYVFHLTFFGGVLAVSGYFEARNKHSVTCLRIPAKTEARDRSSCYRWMCTGGRTKHDMLDDSSKAKLTRSPEDTGEVALDVFFREKYAPALCSPVAKVVVFGVFLFYLAGAVYGILVLDKGLDQKAVLGVGRPIWQYVSVKEQLFNKYPYKIQVVINQQLNYSDSTVRKQIFDLVDKMEQYDFIAEAPFTTFWLDSFLRQVADPNSPLYGADISTERLFITNLKRFLADPANAIFNLDVRFASSSAAMLTANASAAGSGQLLPGANESVVGVAAAASLPAAGSPSSGLPSSAAADPGDDAILASRFLIQVQDLSKSYHGAMLMDDLRTLCDAAPFKVFPYYLLFDLYDQSLQVLPTTIQDALVAGAIMLAISLLMIPNPVSGLCVMATMCTIEAGVIGYMALWGINLDPISMICCIMCIGFSVEFSTHVSHAYVSSRQPTRDEKIREALNNIGTPIIQGGLSMIFALLPIGFSPSYMFVTFFKITFLVTVIGMAHGLALLPLVLSLFDCSAGGGVTCCTCDEPDVHGQLDVRRLGPGASAQLRRRLILAEQVRNKRQVGHDEAGKTDGGVFFVTKTAAAAAGSESGPPTAAAPTSGFGHKLRSLYGYKKSGSPDMDALSSRTAGVNDGGSSQGLFVRRPKSVGAPAADPPEDPGRHRGGQRARTRTDPLDDTMDEHSELYATAMMRNERRQVATRLESVGETAEADLEPPTIGRRNHPQSFYIANR